MREILDILGRKIEVGDVVLRPVFSYLYPHIVLGFTKNGIKFSCKRIKTGGYSYANNTKIAKEIYSISHTRDVKEHNSIQFIQWIPDLCIIEKNTAIPENLQQFIKY